MDDPRLPVGEHRAALAGLARLNAASRAGAGLWRAVRRATSVCRGDRLRVLDVASGGGDVLRGLSHNARRAGIEVDGLGIDVSPTAVELARRDTPVGFDLSFEVLDALRDPLPGGYDVVTSSLFLHHLTESDAVGFLEGLREAAGRAVVVSDLRRTRAGHLLAHAACRLLSRSPVVHFDGPRSVEGAFTLDELAQIARRAGMPAVRIERQWPQRMLATWKR